MKLLRTWPWAGWQNRATDPRRSAPTRTKLSIENLEDRLALSSTPSAATIQQFHAQTFKVDDTQIAIPQVGSPQVTSQNINESFGSLIGLNQTLANLPYKGDNYSIAILDTGINYNLADLGGGWGNTVIAGWNFVSNNSNVLDDNGHGTFVASEIASTSATYSGVAPHVKLIDLKVMDANGAGNFGSIDSALQWVAANQAKYNIVSVNMSLGSGNYTLNPYTFLESDFTTLTNEGVFLAVASGNDYFTYNSQGLAYPAISPNVVSVGAVWTGNFGKVVWANGATDYTTAADQITSFTQRGSALDILAPGALLTGDSMSGGTTQMAGTSMASPIVAAAAALIHQALVANGLGAEANQAHILQIMQSTGTSITDIGSGQDNVTHTGLTFKRLNLLAALNSIAPIYVPPSIGVIGNQTMGSGHTITVNLNVQVGSIALQNLSAVLASPAGLAYSLKTSLGLKSTGNYYTNQDGANEKWIQTGTNVWIAIFPDGSLRYWGGTLSATLQPANLIATLTPAYYNDPSLLWNASPASALPITLSLNGSQLTITSGANYIGSFQVNVTATDGKQTVTQTFTVTVVTPTAPTLGSLGSITISENLSSQVTLTATEPDGDPITFTASIVNPGSTTPAVLSISGGVLTVQTVYQYVGTFAIQVSAADGNLVSSTTFQVTVNPVQSFLGHFSIAASSSSAQFRSDGSWWITAAGVTTEWSQWVPASSWSKIITGDFNGDGKTDVLGFNTDGTVWVGLSTGSGFVTSLWTTWLPSIYWHYLNVGDFNGDGKTDLVGMNNDGSWWVGVSTGSFFRTSEWSVWSNASAWVSIQVGDFTGDGKTDIAGFTTDGRWWVGASTGNYFQTSLWSIWTAPSNWISYTVSDVNGDGFVDVVGYGADGSTWVGASTGKSFSLQPLSQAQSLKRVSAAALLGLR